MRFGRPGRIGQRIVAATLVLSIRHADAGKLPLIREAFDEHYSAAPEEWRRETWRIAAEKAQARR